MKNELLSWTITAAKRARARVAAHIRMRAFARHGRRKFRGDPRYDLRSVSDGFASQSDDPSDDTAILERICAAYCKALEVQSSAPSRHQPTERWRQIELQNLGPLKKALKERNVPALARMLGNFYRDPCSAGILAAPNGQPEAYFSGRIKDIYRHFYLSHVLYRLDYWKSVTGGKFSLCNLEGPGVGNPFGVVLDGIHIGVGAEYAHYCATRVADELGPGSAAVAEIRGGFGAIAYYLLRDRPHTTYMDFDLPETLALATYYLMKSFPRLRFLCYGEKPVTESSLKSADVVLLPSFELARVPAELVTLTLTSFGLSGMTREDIGQCLQEIGRMTREKVFLIGNRTTADTAVKTLEADPCSFTLSQIRESGWHSYKVSGAGVGGAAGLATAAVVEQMFVRGASQPRPADQSADGACWSV